MTKPLEIPIDSLPPKEQSAYIDKIWEEVEDEVKAGKIEKEWYPLSWEERHKF